MRVLGLDIGTYSVKAVELDSSFGRIELGDYLIERVVESDLSAATGGPDSGAEKEGDNANKPPVRQVLTPGQLAALRRLLSERQFKYDKVVVNIPKGWITTRMFQFPTKDRKTIQSSLAFELDDDIPFSMSDVIHDFAIVASEGNSSSVFAAVALSSDLTALISELQMLGLDPDAITIDSWAYGQLLKRAIPQEYEGRPACVVNMGNLYSSIHMFVNESPVLTHVSTCAGLDVTRAIAQTYNLGFDEAEKAKVDGSFLLTSMHLSGDAGGEPISAEQRQFATVIAEALGPLIREIKQTLMSYKANYKMTPRAIFITGGTSLIPNMQLFLEEQLSLPVFPLTYMSRIVGQTLQLSEHSEAQVSSATGLGLSIVKVDRNYNINFRKEAFSKKGGLGSFDMSAFKRPLKYVAASLAFVYINLLIQGIILSSRSSRQEENLERAMKSVLGPVNPSVLATYKSSPSALKSAVNKELAKYKTVQAPPSKPQVNAFDLLNRVSSSMPRDMQLDVSVFQIKDGKLRLSGVVDSPTAPGRIAKALEDTKMLEAVTKDSASEDAKAKKTKFEFSANVAEASKK